MEEFLYSYNKNRQATKAEFSEEDLKGYFDLYVNFKLKVKEAKALGYDKKPAYQEEMAGYRVQLAKPYLAENAVTAALVEEAYQRTLEEVEASHILLELPANASGSDTLAVWNRLIELKRRINQGEAFEESAFQFSEDPSAKQNKGYLGFFGAFQMVYPFETAAFNTPVGEVSNPFRTSFGYHIVFVHSRRKAPGTFRLAHIFFRRSPSDSSAAYQRALEVEKRLQNGGDWNELVQKFSDESSNRDKGGELPWLSLRQLPPSFASEILKLNNPGDLTGVLETEAGWHIVKLLEKKPVPPLSEVKGMIEARISSDERSQKKVAKTSATLMEKLGIVINEPVLATVLNSDDGLLLEGSWTYDASQPFVQKELLRNSDTVLLTADFYRYIELNQKKRNDITAAQYMKELWDEFLLKSLEAIELERLRKTNSNYRFLYNEYCEGTLLFEIMNEKVWQFANTDSVGLEAFFHNNRSRYRWEERADAVIVKSSEAGVVELVSSAPADSLFVLLRKEFTQAGELAAFADSLREKIAQGFTTDEEIVWLVKSPAEFAGEELEAGLHQLGVKFRVQPDSTSRRLTLELVTTSEKVLEGYFNAADPLSLQASKELFEKSSGTIPENFWKKGVHKELGATQATAYFVRRILPAQDKLLTETRGKVVSDYQEHLEARWISELRSKYPLKVNNKAWKNVVKSLQ